MGSHDAVEQNVLQRSIGALRRGVTARPQVQALPSLVP